MEEGSHAQPFEPSKHVDQFLERLRVYEKTSGQTTDPLVWMSLRDLGEQISDVRHDTVQLIQNEEGLQAKLFGLGPTDPELLQGGLIGVITRKLDEAKEGRAEHDVQTKTASNVMWIMRLGAALTTILSGVLVYYILHASGIIH